MAGPLPEPPPTAELTLDAKELSGSCWRVHKAASEAVYFGAKRQENRFDDPKREFGVLYLGTSREAAFVETLLRVPHDGVVTAKQLLDRSMTRVELRSPLRIVPLYGPYIGALHLDTRICSTLDYGICQRWSRALHDHAAAPDGIVYQSRHNSDLLCVAVFERARASVTATLEHKTLLDGAFRPELGEILDRYNVALIE